MQTTTAIMV